MKKRNFITNRIVHTSAMVALTSVLIALSAVGVATYAKTTDHEETVLSILPYSGSDSVPLNDNKPVFIDSELTSKSYEKYGELDELGRCTPAMACIGRDMMPTKERGSISEVKPSGWNQNKYPGVVDDFGQCSGDFYVIMLVCDF